MRSEEERSLVVRGYREYLHLVANTWADPQQARVEVAEKYNLLLASKWKPSTHQEFAAELTRIEQIIMANNSTTLLCWCAPKSCHCDILANYFVWFLGQHD